MGNFSISLYNPNKEHQSKEPFTLSIQSSIFDNVDELFAPTSKTFTSETADTYMERKVGTRDLYRKTVSISIQNAERKPIGALDAIIYNLPYLLSKGQSLDVFIDMENDDAKAQWENSFIVSISDEHGLPDEGIVSSNKPILLLRSIMVQSDERCKGYGRYLYDNFEEIIRSCFGIDFGATFAMNYTLVTGSDTKIDENNIVGFYDNQQGIIMKWLDDKGFQKYKDGGAGVMFFKKAK